LVDQSLAVSGAGLCHDNVTEQHPIAPPRVVLTVRAARWATDALSHDDTTVSALARHLGVAWHTAWSAIETEAKARVARPERLAGVKTLGVDEYIWRPSRVGIDRAVTIMVDLTRDQDGCLHARLLDAVVGRSGTAYKTWLQNQPDGFNANIEQAALDPFRGYANAIRDELPDSVAVADAFHVVRLGTQVVDEVRAASNKTPLVIAGTSTIRSTRSVAYSATA
jgi:transposase